MDAEENDKKQYSLAETTDGRPIAIVDNDILASLDITNWDKNKKNIAKKEAKKALMQFKDGVIIDNVIYKVNKISRKMINYIYNF